MSLSHQTLVRESIRQASDDTWLIGGKILLSRTHHPSPSSRATWSDSNGAFFAISKVLHNNQLLTGELPSNSPIQKVHDAGDAHAVWRIGEAFCKVQISRFPQRTREHTTLEHLHHNMDASFPIPHPLYHDEFDGRYYLFTTKIPGETLEKAWPTMNESTKQFCVNRLVAICKELAMRKNTTICGVDGGQLVDSWMLPPELEHEPDRSHSFVLPHCTAIDMDCSDLVLHHCDMGPQNVIVDLTRMDEPTVGIIDWEMTGFVPRDWIRTKFRVCYGMDFDFAGDNVELSQEWRERVQSQLGQEGFLDKSAPWKARWDAYWSRKF